MAGIAIYEQIRENANVALYAKMAYTDMMTGLKIVLGFIDDTATEMPIHLALFLIS